MAFHSAQGPQLGLPQMIQSRPQFGYMGALLVWAFAYLQYAGFNIFNTILAGDALHTTIHGPSKLWIVVATLLAAVVALVGYDLIHGVERWLTLGFLIIFGILTIAVFTLPYPSGSFDLGAFKATPFLVQFGAVAGYQISWAIYVSDYSRYLPPDVTVRKTFFWTYWGSALGAIWLMCLGAALAAWAGKKFDTIASLNTAGDQFFSGFGAVALIFSTLGLISVTALNMYGGSLTLISAIDSFAKVRPTATVRIVTIAITAVLSVIPALLIGQNFLTNFEDFLLLVLYLFIPWTAVNLVDYYIVRRGHYAIAEIFNPQRPLRQVGLAGHHRLSRRFPPRCCRSSAPASTSGFVATDLNGADISLFHRAPVAGILNYVFAKSIDVEAETVIALAEQTELEKVAMHHQRPEEFR